MPLEAILSEDPYLPKMAKEKEPEQAEEWRRLLSEAGYRALRVVPTSRRRRMESIAEAVDERRMIQGRRTTLSGMIGELMGFCGVQRRVLGNVEQSLRMARVLGDESFQASPGLVAKLLGHRRQANLEAVWGQQKHVFTQAVEKYTRGLIQDNVWDEVLQMEQLVKELNDNASPVSQYLWKTYSIVLFDGFHEFNPAEAQVIASLARYVKVRLWMQGHPRHKWGRDTEESLQRIGVPVENRHVDPREASHDLSRIGRYIFSEDSGGLDAVLLERLNLEEIAQKQDEFVEVAHMVRRAFEEQGECNPDKIAIVVPGPMEARQCRISLENLGIPCYAPAEILQLADSRPARILLQALEYRRSKLSHADVMGFLLSPLVRKRLPHVHGLSGLRELGAGIQGQKTPADWRQIWHKAIEEQAANHLRMTEDPDRVQRRRQELHELAESAREILERLVNCLSHLDPKCPNPGPTLANQLSEFLDLLQVEKTLDPKYRPTLMSAREMQEDQLAWNNLKDMLAGIRNTPANRFPRGKDFGECEWVKALRLGLQGETFALAAADHGKVQILRPLALRGSEFQVVIWVGLNQDEYPLQSRGGTLELVDEAKSLRDQEYLFSQAFESARHRLYLVRSERNGDEHLQPGPFWQRVCERIKPTDRLRKHLGRPKIQVRPPLHPETLPPIESWIAYHGQEKLLLDRQLTGEILRKLWAGEKTFSPTALETYYKCPFRFFAEKTLKLKTDSEERVAMEWGSLLHDALERATEKGQRLPHREDLLAETLRESLAQKQQYLDPFHSHQIKRSLQLITGDAIKKKLQEFIQHEAEVEIKDFLIGNDASGVPVYIRGRIDLVAIHERSHQVTIIDFKTGNITKIGDKVASKRLLQPGLYALYVREQGYAQDKDIAAAYVFIHKKKSGVTGSANFPGQTRGGFSLDLEAEDGPRKAALAAAGQIRQGKIELTAFGPGKPDTECVKYCSCRHACRNPLVYQP